MYGYADCKNIIEYMMMILMRGFGNGIKVGECLGLLVDNGKVLKEIIVKGLRSYKSENT